MVSYSCALDMSAPPCTRIESMYRLDTSERYAQARHEHKSGTDGACRSMRDNNVVSTQLRGPGRRWNGQRPTMGLESLRPWQPDRQVRAGAADRPRRHGGRLQSP